MAHDRRTPPHSPFLMEVGSRIEALARIDQRLREWGTPRIPPAVLRTVTLVLDELFTNVVIHGYRHDESGPVRIEADLEGNAVRVAITDQAPAFDPRQAPFPDTTLGIDERPIGGLGLLLVRRMADTLDYQRIEDGSGPARNVVTFTKRLS